MKPKKLTEDQIKSTLKRAIDDARSFIESEIAPQRIKAQRYFEGRVDIPETEGRSRVVATKCRDTIRAVKPSLMRVFLQAGTPVEFTPRRPDKATEAEQQTEYAQSIFDRNNGFQLLSDAFDDALRKKVGILKAYYDETEEAEFDEYTGLSVEQVAFLMQDPDIEVLEQGVEVEAEIGPDGVPVTQAEYGMKVVRKSREGCIRIDAIAPEDFFVDRAATSIDDCYICGHSTEARVGDLVEMGFDFDKVYDLAGVETEGERYYRGTDRDEDQSSDPSMRPIMLTEAYMKMDIEGAGVPRLYKFICAGTGHEVLDYELADARPFAIFEVDPEPHAFFGRSLVEIIMDDQDAATAMLRGLLDNVSMVNNPRIVVDDTLANLADVQDTQIGGIIRVKDMAAVREIVVGGAAAGIMPVIGYYDESIRAKTGVSGAGMGLDADMLQSQTAQGVNAAVQAANQVSELIARHLAEGGMKQLFKLIIQLARQHGDADGHMRSGANLVPVDPRSWTAANDVSVKVGLGTGRAEAKSAVLREVLQWQLGIWQSGGGPSNGLVSLTNIRNSMAEILKLSGIYAADRFLQPMDPQREQQLLAQAAQAAQAAQGQQPASDPNQAYLQVEGMKASARVQADMAKLRLDAEKMRLEDDRERDRMAQDLAVDVAKMAAGEAAKVNMARLKAEQAMPRGMFGTTQMGAIPNG